MAVNFDFVSSDKFRESLESDYREIELGLAHGAWKSVHVLSGSIIEALLVDYLEGSDYRTKNGSDPLKMDLAKVIDACKAEGVLSQKAADLSSVIRGYRNLIHPARLVRLDEAVDENGARIAKTLTDIIVGEVAAALKTKHGLTAQQVVTKLEHDPSALAIIGSLVKEMPRAEIRRLLLVTIPNRYFEQDAEEWSPAHFARALAICFRTAFDAADDSIKSEVTKKFTSVLREESEYLVLAYETTFFRCSDLKYVDPASHPMVITHILTRAKERPAAVLLSAMQGIGRFVSPDEASELVDIGVRAGVMNLDADMRNAGRALVVGEWLNVRDAVDERFRSRLTDWENHFERRGEAGHLELIRSIIDDCDVPF